MPVPRRRLPRPGNKPAAPGYTRPVRRIPPPQAAPSPRPPRKVAVYRPRPAARHVPAPRRRARHAAFVGPTRPSPARAPLAARRPEGTPRLPAPKAPAVPPGIAPVPRRPGKSPPASAPPKHIAAFMPRPPGSGTAAARAAAFRCAPKGGSNPWAVPAGDRGPLSREFSQNSGVGVLAPKQKKIAPKDDLWWYF